MPWIIGATPRQLEEREAERLELERRTMVAESIRRERVHLASRIGDALRLMCSCVTGLSEEQRAALTQEVLQCRARLAVLDTQEPYYTAGNVTRAPQSEWIR